MKITKRDWQSGGVARTAWLVTGRWRGRRHRRQFATRAAAEAHLRALERDVASGAAARSGAELTVAEIVSQWADDAEARAAAGDLEATTAAGYQTHAGRIWAEPLAHIPAATASVADFQTLADAFRKGVSLATARGRLTAVRMAMKWARSRDVIAHDNASAARLSSSLAERRRPHRVPSRDQLARLVAAILPATDTDAPDLAAAFFSTALFTGARRSEILALTWADVDLERRRITIARRIDRDGRIGPPKTRHSWRVVPIADTLAGVLTRWRDVCPATDPAVRDRLGALVFANTRGRPINPANLRFRGWLPLMKRAGLVDGDGRPLHRIHDLRHAAASVLIDQGLEAKMVQGLLGHSSITVTLDIYGHLFADDGHHERIRAALEGGLARRPEIGRQAGE